MIKKDLTLVIQPLDVVVFDVLEWFNEGYEFGRPCLMLSPVIREDSDSHPEAMIEKACIDACVFKEIPLNNQSDQINWRGWNLKTKRQRFNEVLKGKKFPIAGYKATRSIVRFFPDTDGETSFEIISTISS
jgi:hypothetical protein